MNFADFLAQRISQPVPRTRRGSRAALVVESWDGEYGRFHVTRRETGTLAVRDVIAWTESPYHGVRAWTGSGEDRRFGNYAESDWNEFLSDIRRNGIREPLLIRVMPAGSRWSRPGNMPELREGNHRLQAAIQLGMKEVPVVIDYFGRAEEEIRLAPETPRTPRV